MADGVHQCHIEGSGDGSLPKRMTRNGAITINA